MAIFVGENKTTPETEDVEKIFRNHGYSDVKSYRHSSASVRLRIRDERFRGLSRVARMEILEPIIDTLPEETRQDLIFVLPLAPGEEKGEFRLMSIEFDDPRRPTL